MAWTDYFADARPVGLEQMLDAREARAETQRRLLREHRRPLVCFTLNLPGEYKNYPLACRAFDEGEALIARRLEAAGIRTLHHHQAMEVTGCESYRAVDGAADRVKGVLLPLEEEHALGRLLDIDVLDADGVALRGGDFGRGERRCLICGGPVWACSRSRAHPADALALRAAEIIGDYFAGRFADRVAGLALQSLLCEVNVTPKPGLVDRRNNGAHRDMDTFTFLRSGCALLPYFREVTERGLRDTGPPEALLEALRPLGLEAEAAMLDATGGVNTHKGLIFSLGLVCAAMGYLHGHGLAETPRDLLALCARVAAGTPAELEADDDGSHGRRAFRRYGFTGARGEAAAGFPAVWDHGYPVLRERIARGHSLNDAGAAALLHLLAHVTDTNVLSRSDLETMEELQRRTATLLAEEPELPALLAWADKLDAELIRRNVSPGGCADLLALSFMLFFLFPDG